MRYVKGVGLIFLVLLLLPEKEFELLSSLLKSLAGKARERTEALSSAEVEKDTAQIPEPLTLEKVKKAIDDNGIKFKWVVLSQAVHETNYFKSNIFKQNRNCFGMKLSQRGWAIEENRGHAKYDDVVLSVRDYAAYQRNILFLAKKQGYVIDTEEQYLWLLDNLPFDNGARYAEDKQYTERLRSHMKKLKKSVSW
jgi:hypothetical protein